MAACSSVPSKIAVQSFYSYHCLMRASVSRYCGWPSQIPDVQPRPGVLTDPAAGRNVSNDQPVIFQGGDRSSFFSGLNREQTPVEEENQGRHGSVTTADKSKYVCTT